MIELLNAKFIVDYGDLIKDINKWVCPVRSVDGVWSYSIPTGGLTIVDAREDAFQLNTIGTTNNLTFITRELAHITVERFFLSYTDAQNYLNGTYSLLPYIKTALDSIHQTKGFSHNQLSWGNFYLTFNRPGTNGEVFRRMENMAGFELRACSNSIRPGMNLMVNNE